MGSDLLFSTTEIGTLLIRQLLVVDVNIENYRKIIR